MRKFTLVIITLIVFLTVPTTLVYGQQQQQGGGWFPLPEDSTDFPTLKDLSTELDRALKRTKNFLYYRGKESKAVQELVEGLCPKAISKEKLDLYVAMLDSPTYSTREYYTVKITLECVNNRQALTFHYLPRYKYISKEVYRRLQYILKQMGEQERDDKIASMVTTLTDLHKYYRLNNDKVNQKTIRDTIIYVYNEYEQGNDDLTAIHFPYKMRRALREICIVGRSVYQALSRRSDEEFEAYEEGRKIFD